jgi:hypothetical protein
MEAFLKKLVYAKFYRYLYLWCLDPFLRSDTTCKLSAKLIDPYLWELVCNSYVFNLVPDVPRSFFFCQNSEVRNTFCPLYSKRKNTTVAASVADPDPGSGAFLTPGSGIRDLG